MKLRSPKVEGHILSGLAGGDLGYKGSSCFEVEVDLSKHLWRWRYRFTENDDTKFSKWLIMGIGREKESNEPSSGGNTRGIISVFDHTKASHVATMLSLVDQLQNDDHGWY